MNNKLIRFRGVSFYPAKFKSLIKEKCEKGGRRHFIGGCSSHNLSIGDFSDMAEGHYAVDGFGADAKLFTRNMKTGRTDPKGEWREVKAKVVKIVTGKHYKDIPQRTDGVYEKTSDRGLGNVGFRLDVKEIISSTKKYWEENPLDDDEVSDAQMFLDEDFVENTTPLAQETESEISVTSFSGGSSETKKWLLSDKQLRSKAPREVLLEVFKNESELTNILLDDRES